MHETYGSESACIVRVRKDKNAMAKLPPIQFHHSNETGEKMEFRANVTIDKDGTFNVSIPDELQPIARALQAAKHHVGLSKPGNANQWRVSGKRLDDCRSFINKAMVDYLKCEVATERVICYGHSLRVTSAKEESGRYHPNGYIAQRAVGKVGGGNDVGYQWIGELNATEHAKLYSVGLGAKVFDKVTYRRASGEKVEYKRAHFDHEISDSPGTLLNSFIGLDLVPEYSQQMPYSDEAAQFFYDAMLAMCKLADQVGTFLGNKEKLMRAIEHRVGLLPPGSERQSA